MFGVIGQRPEIDAIAVADFECPSDLKGDSGLPDRRPAHLQGGGKISL
jgi:hypothetical protein